MLKVSVITPIFNSESYLIRCLDSVTNQTLQDIEIICVNDGSTDSSLKLLKEFAVKDKRIKIIDFSENKGVAQARNVGFKNASGDYIYFMDSDDWLDNDYLECMYEAISRSNKPFVHNRSITKIYETDGIEPVFYARPSTGIQNVLNSPSVMWSYIFKKSYLDRFNPLFPEMKPRRQTDEYFYHTVVVPQKEVYVIDISNYYHARRRSSLSFDRHHSYLEYFDLIGVTEKIFEFYKSEDLLSKIPLPLYMLHSHFEKHKFKEKFFAKTKVFFEKIKHEVKANWSLYDGSNNGSFFLYVIHAENHAEYQDLYRKESYFRKLIVRLAACFIMDKQKRRRFREKHYFSVKRDNILKISRKR